MIVYEKYSNYAKLYAKGKVHEIQYFQHSGTCVKAVYYINLEDKQHIKLTHYVNIEHDNEYAREFAEKWVALRTDRKLTSVNEIMVACNTFKIPKSVKITINKQGFLSIEKETFKKKDSAKDSTKIEEKTYSEKENKPYSEEVPF